MTSNIISLQHLPSSHKSSVYNSGKWIDGEKMFELEHLLKDYLSTEYVILTNSGTSALLAAYWVLLNQYKTLNVDPYTFPATYTPAKLLNYSINFTRTINTNSIFPTNNLATITHLFGQPNYALLKNYIGEFIEDACQSFGSEYEGRKVGTFGTFGAFSFYPTKSLHTCGHGGALVTNKEEYYLKAKVFIESGRLNGQMTENIGLNLRMDEIKAEYLIKELENYDSNIEKQIKIAEKFNEVITGIQPFTAKLPNSRHIYSVFNVLIDKRDEFIKFMKSRGISTAIYYDANMLPESERIKYLDITDHIVSIPCRYSLNDTEIERIYIALKEWFK